MRRRAIAIAALVGAMLADAPSVRPQPVAQQTEGSAAERRIATLRATLQRLGAERADIVSAFETADVELAIRREQLGILERRHELLVQEENRQATQVANLERLLAHAREDLAVRVRSLYRVGPLSYHRLLLTADTAQDVLVAYQLVTYLGDRDRRLVMAVRETLDEVAQARDTLAGTADELRRLQQEASAIAGQLERQQATRREALARIDVESEAQRLALQRAERDALELDATLAELDSIAANPERSFADARGALPWPAEGELLTGFGRQRHPVYDTYTVSRGIEIGAAAGDPVVVVFAGRVVFADWYSGYGLLVIVDHGAEHFTLYGHLRDVAVRVGDALAAGDTLGSVGDTGSLTGANLYFEVRQDTDALDPLRWLGRR